MRVMENHKWSDSDVEYVRTNDNNFDVREIVISCSEWFSIHKKDVVALAKEFGLVVYEKDSSL